MGQRIPKIGRTMGREANYVPGSRPATSVPLDSANDIRYRQDSQTTGDLTGQEVVGIYNYNSRNRTDLSFQQGDVMKIKKILDDNYAQATSSKNRRLSGHIPLNYVVPIWYHGNISRKNAELLLKNFPQTNGVYLVRDSTSGGSSLETANMALSIKVEEAGVTKIKHCRIIRGETLYINKKIKFDDVYELVQHYSENPLNLPGGLAYLVNPCPQKFEKYDLSETTKDAWEISHKDFRIIRKIGGGNFGDVYQGAYIGGPEEYKVAIKTTKGNTMGIEEFTKEAGIMKTLKHPHILPLFAVCTEKEPYYIVVQYMNKGSLQDVLRKHDSLISSFTEKVDVLYQISSGMAYLENIGVVHRDLAARNVLINDMKLCKVADFGLARDLQKQDIYNNPDSKFPIRWSALEVINERTYSTKSDVWSFGIVMMEVLLNGELPYKGMDNQQAMANIKRGYRMPRPNECPETLYDNIILKTWIVNPADRPTFDSLMDSLSNYDPEHISDYPEEF